LIPPEKGIDLIILLLKLIGKGFKSFGKSLKKLECNEITMIGYIISVVSIIVGIFTCILNEKVGTCVAISGLILFFVTILFSVISIVADYDGDDDYYHRY